MGVKLKCGKSFDDLMKLSKRDFAGEEVRDGFRVFCAFPMLHEDVRCSECGREKETKRICPYNGLSKECFIEI